MQIFPSLLVVSFIHHRQYPVDSLETQSFFLLHLCLFREYLNLEFQPLWDPAAIQLQNGVGSNGSLGAESTGPLPFEYSLEHIIDDFILLAVFVGNDFLPHLPDLHIHDNALETLFEKYRQTLPKAGDYLFLTFSSRTIKKFALLIHIRRWLSQ
jgi:5'-3' exoribonuclease 1